MVLRWQNNCFAGSKLKQSHTSTRHCRLGRGKWKIVAKAQEKYKAKSRSIRPGAASQQTSALGHSILLYIMVSHSQNILPVVLLDKGVAVATMTARAKEKKKQGPELRTEDQHDSIKSTSKAIIQLILLESIDVDKVSTLLHSHSDGYTLE